MILDVSHVYKSYGKEPFLTPVLKDVSLQVKEGEYVAIMGPSGSGKSTLMNIIGCLDRFDEGSYLLDNVDVTSLKENERSDLRLHKIGFVFQTFQLLSSLSSLENVALPLVYAGIDKKEREDRAKEYLCKVGLEERLHYLPNQLSGGQKQRVAIARAMINHPKILLADEPTGALDQASGKQVMELFRKLNKEEGVTIIMITHDRNVAQNADRTVHIIDGQIHTTEVNKDA